MEDFAQQYDKSGARSGSPQLYSRYLDFFDLKYSLSNVCYILYKNNINKTEKHFKNEQRSKDAAAKKRANTNGVGKINNYCEDIYIPPYNNTH